MPITVETIVKDREPTVDQLGFEDYEKHGFKFSCSCTICEEKRYAYAIHPTKTGSLLCKECVKSFGFESIEDYNNWIAQNKPRPSLPTLSSQLPTSQLPVYNADEPYQAYPDDTPYAPGTGWAVSGYWS